MQRRPERATLPSQACSEEHVHCHRRRVDDKAILATSLTQRLERAAPRVIRALVADEHVHRRRVDDKASPRASLSTSLKQRPERATPWAHQVVCCSEEHVYWRRRRVDDKASFTTLLVQRPENATPRVHQACADEHVYCRRRVDEAIVIASSLMQRPEHATPADEHYGPALSKRSSPTSIMFTAAAAVLTARRASSPRR
jgi:hypothetical protein